MSLKIFPYINFNIPLYFWLGYRSFQQSEYTSCNFFVCIFPFQGIKILALISGWLEIRNVRNLQPQQGVAIIFFIITKKYLDKYCTMKFIKNDIRNYSRNACSDFAPNRRHTIAIIWGIDYIQQVSLPKIK